MSHKATEPQSQSAVEKSIDEPSKSSNQDEFAEEIADDLSEISDEADDILGQQEVCTDIKGSFQFVFVSLLTIKCYISSYF